MTVSTGLLEKLAATVPEPPELPPFSGQRSFDAERFISTHLDVLHTKSWNGGIASVLNVCPFNDDHTDKSAVVIQHPSGALSFKCHHNGCADKKWSDVRELFEPKATRQNGHKPVGLADLTPAPEAGRPGKPPANGTKPDREPPRGYALTDTGNAERFVYWHGPDALHCAVWDKWAVYDRTRYAIDTTQEIRRRATDTVRKIHLEAAYEESDSMRAEIGKHAFRSESESRIAAMLKRAESMRAVSPEDFDGDPMLFNCANGTIDLRTGLLLPHDRDHRLTKCSPVLYMPDAPCPMWHRFLDRVMCGNLRLIRFLQRTAGYAMTGLTIEQVLLFLYGIGRNGKSLCINTIEYVLGDYAKSTRPETLMAKNGRDIPNDIAALVGARFVATIEIDEGARLAESLVKQITGGDRITARFLHGEFFEFEPTFKIWMAGNHKPVIRGTDLAIWERILTIPFEVTIPAEERDKHLAHKLRQEASGILAWMVEGCMEWQQIGLDPPEEVRAATAEYRSEMDILAQFLDDCCEIRREAVMNATALYERYQDWCKASGERVWSQQLFGRRLRERGFEATRTNQARFWEGVELRSTEG